MNLLSSKIRSLYNSFPSLLGQNSLLCQPATFKLARGRGQRFGGRGLKFCAHDWLSTSLLQILDKPLHGVGTIRGRDLFYLPHASERIWEQVEDGKYSRNIVYVNIIICNLL